MKLRKFALGLSDRPCGETVQTIAVKMCLDFHDQNQERRSENSDVFGLLDLGTQLFCHEFPPFLTNFYTTLTDSLLAVPARPCSSI